MCVLVWCIGTGGQMWSLANTNRVVVEGREKTGKFEGKKISKNVIRKLISRQEQSGSSNPAMPSMYVVSNQVIKNPYWF
jgi:predicted Rdx family selenoprotein